MDRVPAHPTAPDDPSPAALKRPAGASRGFYPRKRALVACQVCRKRKTKCDNIRPTCGSCQALQSECNYGSFKPDHSSFDPASLEILEQIGHLTRLLEAQNAHVLGLLPSLPVYQQRHSPNVPNDLGNDYASPSSTISTAQRSHGLNHNSDPQDKHVLISESLEFPASTGTPEDLLDWPVFENKYKGTETEALIFDPHLACGDDHSSTLSLNHGSNLRSAPSRGVQDQDVLDLIDKFLVNVHSKNPISNPDDVRNMSKHIMEHGFEWDARSCFVLIASALGCISSPFKAEYITSELSENNNTASSMDDVSDFATAQSYYVAARKRIGLLKCSILAAQSNFLSGVFEMYCLQPLRAWMSFKEACIILQICLKTQERCKSRAGQRIERCLYWSCLKSECELRMEIDLPPSGLAKVNYSDCLPSPPVGSPDPVAAPAVAAYPSDDSSPRLTSHLEQSWIWYLSDIAMRQISNRLVNVFYQGSASTWLSMPIDHMIRVAEELHLQLTQWYDHVPQMNETLGSPSSQALSDELQYLIRVRLIGHLERLYRPFLYLAIHLPASDPAHSYLASYAKRCLDACMEYAQNGSHRHRHHGTWFQNRVLYCHCLLILAAVRSHRVSVPTGWRDAVNISITGLRFWEREAPDLRKARETLEHMLYDIDHGPL